MGNLDFFYKERSVSPFISKDFLFKVKKQQNNKASLTWTKSTNTSVTQACENEQIFFAHYGILVTKAAQPLFFLLLVRSFSPTSLDGGANICPHYILMAARHGLKQQKIFELPLTPWTFKVVVKSPQGREKWFIPKTFCSLAHPGFES